ncbi:unnamed protein product [Rotaria magnacalcarata]|uniref:Uncharacterized protein n=1 Tax=Rotaria magnacalcarata TaxID=392030 RepID=A0A816N5Q4_9BILA|nr:unnamed protein product [Rotaria magnacalcarata]
MLVKKKLCQITPYGVIWHAIITSDSIIFLVDATDRNLFAKATAELDNLLMNEQNARTSIVTLGTNNDLREAVTEDELRDVFGIFSDTVRNNHQM